MSRNYLIESDVEYAAIDWLKSIGYEHLEGPEIHRNNRQVVLLDRLEAFLIRKYPHLPAEVLQEALRTITFNEGADLDTRNRSFHLKLTKGIDLSWQDSNGKEVVEHIYPLDFDNWNNNDLLAVNQLSIEGRNNRRPDLVLFINGLPLVLFEFKNMFDEQASVENAWNQIQHYINDIPQIFEYNALTIISDGVTTLHGMYNSSMEWYAQWKSIDGRTIINDDFQLKTLIDGILIPERLINYIKSYIFHEQSGATLIKKGAKYHQYFGIQFALKRTLKAIRPFGDGKIGVIWHTTGSGKSITMAIYTGLLRQMPELKNPTILVQVDRNDLDSQLFDNFVLAKDLVGEIKHAKSSDDLREYLSGDGGGVVFSTIEKFRLKETEDGKEAEHPVLSTRDNIIVIADEAQRTQYGLLDGYASNLRKALPNASFVGFTGTPIDSKDADTVDVFGEIIHTYDIKQSVEDNATVRLYYEPRLAKLHLQNEKVDEEAEEIVTGAGPNNANRLLWAAVEDAAGADDRVSKIAVDILSHYGKRSLELEGKAMIVCMSRKNCVKLYDQLSKLEGCPEVAVVITGNIGKDPKEWNKHLRTKDQMEAVKKRFKDPKDPLKLVIVRDMWLTGFDAPCVHTLYVDKIMQGHNLIQAISRVNRIFKDKPNGLIVDYIGIGDRLKDATKKYTGGSTGGGSGEGPTIDVDLAFDELLAVINELKSLLPTDFDYSKWRTLSNGDKLLLVSQAINFLVKDDKKCEDFLLGEKKLSALTTIIKTHPRIQEVSVDILFYQHTGVAIRKIKNPPGQTKTKADQIKDLINRSIESDEIVDVYAMAGMEKPDISILNDDFLIGAKDQKSGLDIKVEILRQILNNEVKLRRYKNIVKYTSLKEEIEAVIKRYHDNAIDSYTTVLELIKRAKEMTEEDQRAKTLGLTDEEMAFYEILAKHQHAISQNDVISGLVKQIVTDIKRNLTVDWYKKPDAKAQIMLSVKKTLRGKISLEELNAVMDEIMEQAQARYMEWGEVA